MLNVILQRILFLKRTILEKEKQLILNVKLQPVHSYICSTLLANLLTQ